MGAAVDQMSPKGPRSSDVPWFFLLFMNGRKKDCNSEAWLRLSARASVLSQFSGHRPSKWRTPILTEIQTDIQTHRYMDQDPWLGNSSAKQQTTVVDLSKGRLIGGSCSWVVVSCNG